MTGTNTEKRKIVSLDKKKARAGWFFIAPFLVVFALIYVPVLFDSIRYSFSRLDISAGGFSLYNVGFENYTNALFVNAEFVPTLISGLLSLLFDIPAIVIFSLFMAVILNQKMPGRAIFRAIFFIPVILSTGIIDQIDVAASALTSYMNSDVLQTGMETAGGAQGFLSSMDIQALFSNMAVGQELVTYVTDIVNNIYDIVNRSGVQMLVFLAALQSISPSIYESAYMEGASSWETFWKITFPMISPMILVNGIYTVIDSFTASSNEVMSFINVVNNEAGGKVVAAAMSWIYFLIVLAVIAVVAGIMSAYVFYQRRD